MLYSNSSVVTASDRPSVLSWLRYPQVAISLYLLFVLPKPLLLEHMQSIKVNVGCDQKLGFSSDL